MVTISEVARTVMRVCGRNDLYSQTSAPRPGDVHVLHADTRRAEEALGYRAEIIFEDGVRRYVDWFKARNPDPSVLLEEDVENWKLPAQGEELRSNA
jgi:UDP-glucose 4-epimerase